MLSLKTVAALNTLHDTALHKSNFWCFKPLGLVAWNVHLVTGSMNCYSLNHSCKSGLMLDACRELSEANQIDAVFIWIL